MGEMNTGIADYNCMSVSREPLALMHNDFFIIKIVNDKRQQIDCLSGKWSRN